MVTIFSKTSIGLNPTNRAKKTQKYDCILQINCVVGGNSVNLDNPIHTTNPHQHTYYLPPGPETPARTPVARSPRRGRRSCTRRSSGCPRCSGLRTRRGALGSVINGLWSMDSENRRRCLVFFRRENVCTMHFPKR